jgi:hypothetical protein
VGERVQRVGASGPVAQKLFRNFEQMSAEDQDDLARFAALLAEKNRRRKVIAYE